MDPPRARLSLFLARLSHSVASVSVLVCLCYLGLARKCLWAWACVCAESCIRPLFVGLCLNRTSRRTMCSTPWSAEMGNRGSSGGLTSHIEGELARELARRGKARPATGQPSIPTAHEKPGST